MALRDVLQFSSDAYPGWWRSGRALPPDLGYRQSARADDEPVWRQRAGSLRTTAREMRETVAAIAFIGRFVLFVTGILVEHHLRRLWPGATLGEAEAIAATLRRTAATRRQAAMAPAGPGASALAFRASCATPRPKVGALRRRAAAHYRG